MHKRLKNKKGDLNISFGMIFSIILIIIFLAFGFYAIKKFLDLQSTIQVQNFLRDFQNDVDNTWRSEQGSTPISYPLPKKITAVCFEDDKVQNLKLISTSLTKGDLIENIDITRITEDEDPYCIPTLNGKVSLKIVKEFGETLVRVERQ